MVSSAEACVVSDTQYMLTIHTQRSQERPQGNSEGEVVKLVRTAGKAALMPSASWEDTPGDAKGSDRRIEYNHQVQQATSGCLNYRKNMRQPRATTQ